jgi:hypothetical protein
VEGRRASEPTLERPVIDFDHHSAELGLHAHEIIVELRDPCPVRCTAAYGGYWVPSPSETVAGASCDQQRFSSGSGLAIPPLAADKPNPSRIDPPDHTEVGAGLA